MIRFHEAGHVVQNLAMQASEDFFKVQKGLASAANLDHKALKRFIEESGAMLYEKRYLELLPAARKTALLKTIDKLTNDGTLTEKTAELFKMAIRKSGETDKAYLDAMRPLRGYSKKELTADELAKRKEAYDIARAKRDKVLESRNIKSTSSRELTEEEIYDLLNSN